MLVKRGLPVPRNKKGATPVGEKGELLGWSIQTNDDIEETDY